MRGSFSPLHSVTYSYSLSAVGHKRKSVLCRRGELVPKTSRSRCPSFGYEGLAKLVPAGSRGLILVGGGRARAWSAVIKDQFMITDHHAGDCPAAPRPPPPARRRAAGAARPGTPQSPTRQQRS